MKSHINISQQQINDYCQRWEIDEMAFFGSVLRDDFGPDSDIDILVHFSPEAQHTLFDMVRMRNELQSILGRNIDLVSRDGIETSRNALRRRAILQSAEVVYAA